MGTKKVMEIDLITELSEVRDTVYWDNIKEKPELYTTNEVDGLLNTKADKSDTYNKAEINAALTTKADKSNTYTKSEVDAELALKADKSNTYNKTEVQNLLAEKPDLDVLYTKSQTDQLLTTKQNKLTAGEGITISGDTISSTLDFDVFVVVPALPEVGQTNKIYLVPLDTTEEFNIYMEYAWVNNQWELLGEHKETIDLTEYLKKTEAAETYQPKGSYATTAQLELKADKATTYSKSEVDSGLASKADSADVYTKTEINEDLALPVANAFSKIRENLSLNSDFSVGDGTPVDLSLLNSVYTKSQTDQLLTYKQNKLTAGEGIIISGDTISSTLNFDIFVVVPVLPEVGQKNKIYLVPLDTTEEYNIYMEYAWVNNQWELLGEHKESIDLTEYIKKTEAAETYQPKGSYATTAQLEQKADKTTTYTKSEVDAELALKADSADVYTKTEINEDLALPVANAFSKIRENLSLNSDFSVGDGTPVDLSLLGSVYTHTILYSTVNGNRLGGDTASGNGWKMIKQEQKRYGNKNYFIAYFVVSDVDCGVSLNSIGNFSNNVDFVVYPEGLTKLDVGYGFQCKRLSLPESTLFIQMPQMSVLSTLVLPSNIVNINELLTLNSGNVNKIVSKAMVAPMKEVGDFGNNLYGVAQEGVLYVPKNATGYDAWMDNLEAAGKNWTLKYIED